ncbi:ATP-binding protein [Variovorax sp. J31P207]|uniref:AlbA family DNA-binding domain-containing protein n=1 Tax=Variovorax sp. J31P207 TaxID=3053510 RepID=UPI002576ED06|nr:ATP-binding protein [Variovorax sp. J31P207]MDM0065303.1 ATP-binding protein [Variovorax sp. J31P207]
MDLHAWFASLTHAKILKMAGDVESQVFDCKRVGDEGDIKRNLATVLSGFANGAGGVCLWGVTAKKNAHGIDCVTDFPGVPEARKLASRLDELTPQAVAPGVPGVVHRALTARGQAHGFVVTFVPPSDGGPHMARFGEDRYYQRIGLSFMRMEPFQIADMFGRRARPRLEVTAIHADAYQVQVQITNAGRGAARGLYLQLAVAGPFGRYSYGIDGNGTEALKFAMTNPDGSWIHAADSSALLHPTMNIRVGGVWLGPEPGRAIAKGLVPNVLRIPFKVGALDVEPTSGVLEVDLS